MSLLNQLDEHIDIDAIPYKGGLISVVSPRKRINTQGFLTESKSILGAVVRQQGALLLRRFKLNGAKDFLTAVETLSGNKLCNYENKSTPRSQVIDRIFTSTEYPSDAFIPLHNENSYTHTFPRYLYFFCLKKSISGGQTPLANSALIHQALDEKVKDEFLGKGVRYVRNYGEIDLPWQEVFGTDKPQEVSEYCEKHSIDYKWNNNQLRTEECCPASILHPDTKEDIWFNQAHLFHYSNLGEGAQDLINVYGLNNIPRNALFADGEAIPKGMLDHIRDTLNANEILFDWQPGDLLILDNLKMAHGRKPFEGQRKVLVAMSEELTHRELN
ncbi:TauD/TfdA family dioxygenase [Teredinibacter turnerae]|uniref:TauD/TfdA family dioxygenase n=1 Tax=Teredinibacter turnerae TaxID=2426 RepID=UPI0004035894|nr:TauD/TfdA family dioxygenase [Teredinibacter turnerae]